MQLPDYTTIKNYLDFVQKLLRSRTISFHWWGIIGNYQTAINKAKGVTMNTMPTNICLSIYLMHLTIRKLFRKSIFLHLKRSCQKQLIPTTIVTRPSQQWASIMANYQKTLKPQEPD